MADNSRALLSPADARTLRSRMDSLVIFRGLLQDPVVSQVRELLDACCDATGEDALIPSVAELAFRLESSDAPVLSDYVCSLVLDSENPYTHWMGVSGKPSERLASLLETELQTLRLVAEVAPENFFSSYRERPWLPAFEAGAASGLADAYHDRIANAGRYGFGMYARHRMFVLGEDGTIIPVRHSDPTTLADLVDYERERSVIIENTKALLEGLPAANVLLTGDAGTGKSSTVKAIVNELYSEGLRILEVRKDQLHLIPALLDELYTNPLKFIIFIDDLSFQDNDDNYAALKAILEGSVAAKSNNVVVYATSNRRHLVRETFSSREGDEVHFNDTMQEIMSLSERFGIHVTFEKPNKEVYLDIVHRLASDAGISYDPVQLNLLAERYALRRGGRSARAARQFVDGLISGSQQL